MPTNADRIPQPVAAAARARVTPMGRLRPLVPMTVLNTHQLSTLVCPWVDQCQLFASVADMVCSVGHLCVDVNPAAGLLCDAEWLAHVPPEQRWECDETDERRAARFEEMFVGESNVYTERPLPGNRYRAERTATIKAIRTARLAVNRAAGLGDTPKLTRACLEAGREGASTGPVPVAPEDLLGFVSASPARRRYARRGGTSNITFSHVTAEVTQEFNYDGRWFPAGYVPGSRGGRGRGRGRGGGRGRGHGIQAYVNANDSDVNDDDSHSADTGSGEDIEAIQATVPPFRRREKISFERRQVSLTEIAQRSAVEMSMCVECLCDLARRDVPLRLKHLTVSASPRLLNNSNPPKPASSDSDADDDGGEEGSEEGSEEGDGEEGESGEDTPPGNPLWTADRCDAFTFKAASVAPHAATLVTLSLTGTRLCLPLWDAVFPTLVALNSLDISACQLFPAPTDAPRCSGGLLGKLFSIPHLKRLLARGIPTFHVAAAALNDSGDTEEEAPVAALLFPPDHWLHQVALAEEADALCGAATTAPRLCAPSALLRELYTAAVTAGEVTADSLVASLDDTDRAVMAKERRFFLSGLARPAWSAALDVLEKAHWKVKSRETVQALQGAGLQRLVDEYFPLAEEHTEKIEAYRAFLESKKGWTKRKKWAVERGFNPSGWPEGAGFQHVDEMVHHDALRDVALRQQVARAEAAAKKQPAPKPKHQDPVPQEAQMSQGRFGQITRKKVQQKKQQSAKGTSALDLLVKEAEDAPTPPSPALLPPGARTLEHLDIGFESVAHHSGKTDFAALRALLFALPALRFLGLDRWRIATQRGCFGTPATARPEASRFPAYIRNGFSDDWLLDAVSARGPALTTLRSVKLDDTGMTSKNVSAVTRRLEECAASRQRLRNRASYNAMKAAHAAMEE